MNWLHSAKVLILSILFPSLPLQSTTGHTTTQTQQQQQQLAPIKRRDQMQSTSKSGPLASAGLSCGLKKKRAGGLASLQTCALVQRRSQTELTHALLATLDRQPSQAEPTRGGPASSRDRRVAAWRSFSGLLLWLCSCVTASLYQFRRRVG